jgi:anti-sigma B factor antagonist
MGQDQPEPTPAGLRLDRVTTTDGVHVIVHGEVDMATAFRLREELVDAGSSKPPHVTIDAAGVSFIDSSGLSALVEARDVLAPATNLRLTGLNGHVRRLLQISGLIDEFEIVER